MSPRIDLEGKDAGLPEISAHFVWNHSVLFSSLNPAVALCCWSVSVPFCDPCDYERSLHLLRSPRHVD